MKQKGLSLIVIIVLMAVFAVGGYLLYSSQTKPTPPQQQNPVITSQTPQSTQVSSSTPDETANWKTYTNTRFGYSLRYPENWSLEEVSISEDFPEEFKYFTSIASPRYEHVGFTQTFSIDIRYLPNGLYGERAKESNQETINNYQVIRSKPVPQYTSEIVFFKIKDKDNQYISVGFDPYSEKSPYPNQEDAHQIFNQILSTFKFIP